MLVFDLHTIGNKLYAIRKRSGMTQMEVAVAADMSERTYADIERGTVNMRILTFLRICQALGVRPDEICVEEDNHTEGNVKEVLAILETCQPQKKEMVLRILSILLTQG